MPAAHGGLVSGDEGPAAQVLVVERLETLVRLRDDVAAVIARGVGAAIRPTGFLQSYARRGAAVGHRIPREGPGAARAYVGTRR